ncbi:unnamed protein product [Leptosia nina]|uniref:RNA helicase n=1 Tax=Leptosia nina TaxID=320188 RepID=A0AAV1JKS0_9NEOP
MAPPGTYEINIIHYLNPYLIWIEVPNSHFEQIGIYGILPCEKLIDFYSSTDALGLTNVKTKEWMPAATKLMKDFLGEAAKTWFSLTYVDRRSSIFDDNIHKFGDITIETKKGETKNLSQFLVNSAFASHNESEFHGKLLTGTLTTKLNIKQLENIIKCLEKYCGADKHKLAEITTVAKNVINLEDELRTFNLDSNDEKFQKIVHQKRKDYELCKDSEEESFGRALRKIINENKDEELQDKPFVLRNYFDKLEHFQSSQGSTSGSEINGQCQKIETKTEVKQSAMSKKLALLKMLSQSNSKANDSPSFPKCEELPVKRGIHTTMTETEHQNNEENKTTYSKLDISKKQTNFPDVINDVQINKKPIDLGAEDKGKISMMKRKLIMLKTASKASQDALEKGTNQNDELDDELDDIIEYINATCTKNKPHSPNKPKELIEPVNSNENVQILSTQMCNFVEKIVTPVVMVHCKYKKNIKPIYTLTDIPFNKHINTVLKNMSINRAMSLQSVSWHTILRGHSFFMIGPKASGKTMGYLPCVCRSVSDRNCDITNTVGPICIIVCATAKSVADVEKIAKTLLGFNEQVLACYAGVDNMFITTSLLNRCDLLIATPLALVRLLHDSDFGVDLRRLQTFVLDDYERLDAVYKKEIKFFTHKIRELEKTREKELRVQIILASRIWCDSMEHLAKKAADTVIAIGAFPECVIYSKSHMTVCFVDNNKKTESVLEFMNEIDASKKIVIVCRYSEEVKALEKQMKHLKNHIFTCDSDMTIHDLYNLNAAWDEYQVPLIGPILICTDDNLSHLNITDASYLIHFSLPKAYSFFSRRFSVLKDNYTSIFRSETKTVKIKMLLEEANTEKLPKILNFLKRCTDVPPSLDAICENLLEAKDVCKAKQFVPICDGLLALGYCPEFHDCQNRHKVLNGYDDPPVWMPKSGIINFTILHFHSATNYSAHLLAHIDKDSSIKYPATYSTLSVKLGMYFGNTSNRKLHGIPKVGDICAVSIRQDLFVRCQIVKILSVYQKGKPNYVLIRLIDEEKYEKTRDIYLYHLPKEFQCIDTHVVQIRLANVQPKDRDVTFSKLASDHIRSLVNEDDDLYVRGRIAGVIGNCIFVDTLKACRELSTLAEVVVKHDLRYELLQKHAEPFPDHIKKLMQLCSENNFSMISERQSPEKKKTKKHNSGSWAHLVFGEHVSVYVTSLLNPDECFMRLHKFEPCMQLLLKDIKKYIDTTPKPLSDIEEGDIVLAKFPDDDVFERARIDAVNKNLIKCFFVDQGDWAFVPSKYIFPITDKLINQLPFQAIECRLIGLKPPGATWTDFCINWLSNYTDEGTKALYAKYFKKEPAKYTAGSKYSVSLVDTNALTDIVVNQLMIDLNLAQIDEDEIHFLEDIMPKAKGSEGSSDSVVFGLDEDDWEKVSRNRSSSPKKSSANIPLSDIFLPAPKRSVPLVGSDDSDCDSWDIGNPSSFLGCFKAITNADVSHDKPANEANQPLALKAPESHNEDDSIGLSKKSNTSKSSVQSISDGVKSPDFQLVSKKLDLELDSDDTVTSVAGPNTSTIDETRKPKLTWRQNKTSVNIKIQLIGVEKYELHINERTIHFSTFVHDTKYSFGFELYAVVNTKLCSHANKGQYILVKLVKVLQKNWLTLTKDPELTKWIVYDVDGIEASSDEDVVDDTIVKIVKHMHDTQDTDSDDGDAVIDDIDYRYK